MIYENCNTMAFFCPCPFLNSLIGKTYYLHVLYYFFTAFFQFSPNEAKQIHEVCVLGNSRPAIQPASALLLVKHLSTHSHKHLYNCILYAKSNIVKNVMTEVTQSIINIKLTLSANGCHLENNCVSRKDIIKNRYNKQRQLAIFFFNIKP